MFLTPPELPKRLIRLIYKLEEKKKRKTKAEMQLEEKLRKMVADLKIEIDKYADNFVQSHKSIIKKWIGEVSKKDRFLHLLSSFLEYLKVITNFINTFRILGFQKIANLLSTCLYNKAPFNCKSELRIANYGVQNKKVIKKYNSHHKEHKSSTKVYKQSPPKNKCLKLLHKVLFYFNSLSFFISITVQ